MSQTELSLVPIRGMRAKLLPTVVAALGLVICAALVIIIGGFSGRLDGTYQTTFESLARSISITKSTPHAPQATGIQSLRDSDVRALSRELDPNLVSDIVPITKGTAMVRHDGTQYRATVTGATPNYLRYKNTPLKAGAMFTQQQYAGSARVALVGKSVGKALFGGDGSAALNSTVFIGRLPFQVIGLIDNNATGGGGASVVAPLTTVRNDLLGGIRTVGEIGLLATSIEAVAPAQERVGAILARQHTQRKAIQQDFSADTLQAGKSAVGAQLLTVLFWVAAAIAAAGLLVGLVGLAIVLKAEARVHAPAIERREAGGGAVAARLLLSATVVAVVAGLVGVGAGIGLTLAGRTLLPELGPQYGMPSVSPLAVALAVGLSVVTGLFAGSLPAARTARARGRSPVLASPPPLLDAVTG